MEKFEILEDVATADIAFRANGKDLNKVFENAALATAETLADTSTIKEEIVEKVSIKEEDKEQMLYAFLEEILFLKDSKDLFFSRFEVNIQGKKLTANMYGEETNKHITFRDDVKAITMYMLKIEKKEDKYTATVVLDI